MKYNSGGKSIPLTPTAIVNLHNHLHMEHTHTPTVVYQISYTVKWARCFIQVPRCQLGHIDGALFVVIAIPFPPTPCLLAIGRLFNYTPHDPLTPPSILNHLLIAVAHKSLC